MGQDLKRGKTMKTGTLVAVLLSTLLMAGVASAKKDQGQGHSHGTGLPPGLQKNQERGKPLPPGWQKKLSKGDILDDDIYARGRIVVPVGKDGTLSIEVEGTILRLHKDTREILDIVGR